MSNKLVLGLIGGIGSGKSLVAAELVKHGGHLIAADQLGHEALAQPDIKQEVVRRWGPDVLDEKGAVIRRRLGEKVFADAAERRALEALVFPYIERRVVEEIAAAQLCAEVAFIVLDAAIMLETGWNKVCDVLVYIHAPRAVRLHRLAERRGWTAKEVAARESAQMPLTDKATRADWAIDNSGAPEDTARQTADLVHRLGIPHRHCSQEFR